MLGLRHERDVANRAAAECHVLDPDDSDNAPIALNRDEERFRASRELGVLTLERTIP
jgi:hypothetical protein